MTDRLNPAALDQEALEAGNAAAKDELWGRLNGGYISDEEVERAATAAVSAYLAALPAPRTITTVEDAEKLPNMSVLIDADGAAFQRSGFDLRGPWWSCLGDTFPTEEITFPAVVLWMPTEGGGE